MDKVVFSKFSKDRETRFQIATMILEDGQERKVRKEPIHEAGWEHVSKMEHSFHTLSGLYDENKVALCPCSIVDGGVEFPFVQGRSLGNQIREHADAGDFKKIKEDYTFLWEIICAVGNQETFVPTQEFEAIFGKPSLKEGLQAASVSNIDMIPENILIGTKNYLVDYEWVFFFQVPLEYIYARSVFLQEAASSLTTEQQLELYAVAGIEKTEIPEYYKMEVSFQEYVAGPEEKYSLSGIHQLMHKQVYHISDWQYDKDSFSLKIEGLRKGVWEEVFYETCYDQDVKREIKIENTEEFERFRIYPVNSACIISLDYFLGVRDGVRETPEFTGNKNALIRNEYYLLGKPEILLENKNYDRFLLHYTVESHGENSMRQFMEFMKRDDELTYKNSILQDRIVYLEEKVRQLENLRVYKAYRKIRRIIKRGND